jgi:hypothetical protein
MTDEKAIVVDIEDTLLDMRERTREVWQDLLGRDVILEDAISLEPVRMIERYGSKKQRKRIDDLVNEYWDLLLCKEQCKFLDKAEEIPSASDVLKSWKDDYQIVYVSDLLEPASDELKDQLMRFNNPIRGTERILLSLEEYKESMERLVGFDLVDARRRVMSRISDEYDIVRVIDDHPDYFRVYRDFDISERLGFYRPRAFSTEDYLSRGATRVMMDWEELLD